MLITITDYKNYKGINGNKDDNRISSIIEGVNTFAKTYCGRTFIDFFTTNKTEYFNSNFSDAYVEEYPINTLVSVKVSTDGGVTQTALVENTDFFVDKPLGRIISSGTKFSNTTIEFQSLEVIYTGGYSSTPDDIKLALLDLTAYYVKEEFVPSRSLNGASIINVSSSELVKLPAHIRRVLEAYRIS